ncbi:hypothetical protein C2845_PM09G22510 [Panicum miliaceum]|uniref:Uncharacterized protein n=1 Tax=Panicum miliaceum TaxID=4540 RepID=A0A3L6RZD1_PANMI|nr:hypothetical protein C2845_PM09G22510 [Panicum miliaceum]
MAGCVASLYDSVEQLDAAYVRSADARAALLAPAGGYESGRLLQLQAVAAPAAVEVYQCSKGSTGDCYSYVAAVRGTPCRRCRSAMNVPIELIGCSGGGFSRWSCWDGVHEGGRDVQGRGRPGLEILRVSLQSKTVLMDIFRGPQTSYFLE